MVACTIIHVKSYHNANFLGALVHMNMCLGNDDCVLITSQIQISINNSFTKRAEEFQLSWVKHISGRPQNRFSRYTSMTIQVLELCHLKILSVVFSFVQHFWSEVFEKCIWFSDWKILNRYIWFPHTLIFTWLNILVVSDEECTTLRWSLKKSWALTLRALSSFASRVLAITLWKVSPNHYPLSTFTG